ncbi:MAG: sulfate transporter CysZ [Gammaproteobacteria bacterium]|nr:sulfate transporter CysZ [Gammaproteobacteria bacterium]
MNNPFIGARYLLRGFQLIIIPGIRRYVLIPLAINTLLFIAVIWFGIGQFSELVDWAMNLLPVWLQEWLTWLRWIFYILFGLLTLLIVFFTFSLVANIVAAPFNDRLAGSVAKHLSTTIAPSARQSLPDLPHNESDEKLETSFIKQFAPLIANELKKLAYFVAWSIPFLLLFFIPVINLAAPLLWFLFSAWILNLEYMDYPMGRKNLLFSQQRKRLKPHKFLALGFGSAVSIATMIPIVNFLVIPAAVAGATALWVERLENQSS